jgi:hypothetical protein
VAVAAILESAGSDREGLADVLEVPVTSSCEEPDERDVPELIAVSSTMRVKERGCDVCEGGIIALDVSLRVLEDTSCWLDDFDVVTVSDDDSVVVVCGVFVAETIRVEALLRVLCCVSLRLLATLPCPEMVAGYVLAGI